MRKQCNGRSVCECPSHPFCCVRMEEKNSSLFCNREIPESAAGTILLKLKWLTHREILPTPSFPLSATESFSIFKPPVVFGSDLTQEDNMWSILPLWGPYLVIQWAMHCIFVWENKYQILNGLLTYQACFFLCFIL